MEQMLIDDLAIEVVRKRIKNVYIRINPLTRKINVSAPLRASEAVLRQFLLSKIDWVRQCLSKTMAVKLAFLFESGETHYVQGKPYQLQVVHFSDRDGVILTPFVMELHLRKKSDIARRQAILETWYRRELLALVASLIVKWEAIIGVSANEFRIKKMKTKWGTCNPVKRRIWLNLELIKKPIHCIEYVVVHELVHLLERSHNRRFCAFMDRFLPPWREYKKELNA